MLPHKLTVTVEASTLDQLEIALAEVLCAVREGQHEGTTKHTERRVSFIRFNEGLCIQAPDQTAVTLAGIALH